MLNDHILHRILILLVLKNVQRLGSNIISATFNRIIIAKNNTHMDVCYFNSSEKNMSGVGGEDSSGFFCVNPGFKKVVS